ncbi:MAG: hypothetical protein AB7I30_07120 [Isosphaeraceae bacterium]
MTSRGLLAGLLTAWAAATLVGSTSRASDAADVARRVLDDSRPRADREALVNANAAISAELLTALVEGMRPGTPEEYRRIPWIWRVAIAVGKRNEGPEIVRLLERSLPVAGGRLDDWRAVVLGGGIVNGITQAGDWPGARIDGLLQGHPDLEARWRRAIDLASVMADDPMVPDGTRYDALRMLGTQPWERRGAQLFRYLLKGTPAELQMGAVSGLGDVPSPCAAQALLSGIGHYDETNRNLALDALLRDESRAQSLLDAVADGRVTRAALGSRRVKALTEHPSEAIRRRAVELLGEPGD